MKGEIKKKKKLRPFILALGGSIRVTPKRAGDLNKIIEKSEDMGSFLKAVQSYGEEGKAYPFSNTEVMAGAALMGAKEKGAEVFYYPLMSLFSRKEGKIENYNQDQLSLSEDVNYIDTLEIDAAKRKDFENLVGKSHGVILSSPVYFGDRSSIANKFFHVAQEKKLLEGKVFSCLTAGAKRNGGQETASIFALYEALEKGAFIVGNGPKSSQYGGTVVAGDKKMVLEDEWGLETCFSTGKRTTSVSRIVLPLESGDNSEKKFRVKVLITMDYDSRYYEKLVGEIIQEAQEGNKSYKNVSVELIPLIGEDIYRCLACNICPIPEKLTPVNATKDSYACIINNKRDSLEVVREKLLEADALIVAGVNLEEKNLKNLIYRYQAFIERTRFVRRNDFELTNIPVTGLCVNYTKGRSNPLHNLKVMTSYMRHNMIVCSPINIWIHEGKVIDKGVRAIRGFFDQAALITKGRDISEPEVIRYEAGGFGGYSDTRLDHTSKQRV